MSEDAVKVAKESWKEIILALAAAAIMIMQAYTAMGVRNNQTFIQALDTNKVAIAKKIRAGVTGMINVRELQHIREYHLHDVPSQLKEVK